MADGIEDPTKTDKSDSFLREQLVRRFREEHLRDIFEYSRRGNDDDFSCRFKDNCYAFKTNMGTCPCGLEK